MLCSTATRSLQASENAHKHTVAELQRTRSTLLSVRKEHAAEIKRGEKDTKLILDRWTNIADLQAKLGTASSSLAVKLTRVNTVAQSSVEGVLGRGKGLLEQAVEEAELGRKELGEENQKLKGILLSAVNELSATLHSARQTGEGDTIEV